MILMHYHICTSQMQEAINRAIYVRLLCEYSQKTSVFTSKQCPQVPEQFEISGKTFMVLQKL